jgi:hypothetical protein
VRAKTRNQHLQTPKQLQATVVLMSLLSQEQDVSIEALEKMKNIAVMQIRGGQEEG